MIPEAELRKLVEGRGSNNSIGVDAIFPPGEEFHQRLKSYHEELRRGCELITQRQNEALDATFLRNEDPSKIIEIIENLFRTQPKPQEQNHEQET